jgi:hypothetical protein
MLKKPISLRARIYPCHKRRMINRALQAAEKLIALKGRGFSRAITAAFPMWL